VFFNTDLRKEINMKNFKKKKVKKMTLEEISLMKERNEKLLDLFFEPVSKTKKLVK